MNAGVATVVRTRRPGNGRLAAAALVAVLALAAPVAAQPWRLSAVTPFPPTWRDRVEVTVTGNVAAGCGAALGEPLIDRLFANSYRVELPLLVSDCVPTTVSSTVALIASLPPLQVGSYTLRLVSGGTLDQISFQVYEAADGAIDVPALSTDAQPGSLKLTLLTGPGSLAAQVGVVESVIEVAVQSPPATPRPRQLATLEVPLPPLVPGNYAVRVLLPALGDGAPGLLRGALRVWSAASCLPDAKTLCLQEGRFRVTASWRDFPGRTGAARAAPLTANEGSGLLWFFAADNAEVTLKILDGCGVNQHWWAFVSSSSTVEHDIAVTDTSSGETRHYRNELGQMPRLLADTDAFACP